MFLRSYGHELNGDVVLHQSQSLHHSLFRVPGTSEHDSVKKDADIPYRSAGARNATARLQRAGLEPAAR